MNPKIEKLIANASDTGALARDLAKSGLKSVSDIVRGLELTPAISAGTSEEVEHDETHYLLIPLLGGIREYAIYVKRVLPSEFDGLDSLPKLRIFHVPDESAEQLLRQELIREFADKNQHREEPESPLANKLAKVGDLIDEESSRVSGGILLIGGAVAFVNPIAGAGIALHSLIPAIGGKMSKLGGNYLAERIRRQNRKSDESKRLKESSKEVRNLRPKIYTNPIIRSLESIKRNPQIDYDPFLDRQNWPDSFEKSHYFEVTREAICEVYAGETNDSASWQDFHLAWIRSFSDQ